ncbi:MAG: patatin-like phospholipase family protein [Acidobacteria bacterium]|nr:patatin-like phospholipase family protein [Acidobacteriota bacterium]
MSKTIRILSIDGGGIRGILPAMLLASLERRTGQPVSQLFDLIAGTSTGGILALGLTRPGENGKPAFSAEDMAALYEREGDRIFASNFWHKLRSLGAIGDQKYPSRGVDEVLQRYFGETRLSEALTSLVVPSYEIERRVPFFFKSAAAKRQPTHDFPMWQVARATSAAPTYFEPARLDAMRPGDYWALIDGGVFANNPAACALVEARTQFPDAANFLVCSIGTGALTRRIAYDDARNWGLARWAKPVLDIVLDSVSETVDYQLTQLLPAGSYYRFQASLQRGSEQMDETSPGHIRGLRLVGEKLVRDNARSLDTLAGQLAA